MDTKLDIMDTQESKPSTTLESTQISISETGLETGTNLSLTQKTNGKAGIIAEIKKQMQLAGPLIIVSFLQFSMQMISVMFVGHLGELPLASASMAAAFAGVSGFSLMLGMGGALETFCGQAYGAEQYHMLGVHMQRAMLVFMLMSIPISFLWAFTDKILVSLKQDPQISFQAGEYARWLIPSIFPYGLLQCQVRFLQTQNSTLPLMISTGITSVFHVLLCWNLIFRFQLGNRGAALSNTISYWTNVFILACYIKFSISCRKTWKGFSKEGTKNLFTFVKLAVPSALMYCLEYWSYEFLVLMSGLLQNPKLETSMMTISLNTMAVIFRIPFGLASAVSTRVSNELGAGKPYAARLAVYIALFLAVVEGLSASSIEVAARHVWGYLYTNEKEVVKYIASVMPVLAIFNFMEGIQGVLSGCARGCGWQKIGALITLGAYYFVGLPSAVVLTFVFHFGGKGLWMGITAGSALQAAFLLLITLRTNWEKQASKAKDRVSASSIIPEEMASA
ncbi:protein DETOXIFICATION 16-like [Jatropha curcas]|uniref:protein DETOXIFICATION 16-like n=1 Tax=Jatropha curcas TaxID=180498 RepID=UPI0005FAC279|nr:protein DETOXIFICATION 16-like [Jatropha curcas]